MLAKITIFASFATLAMADFNLYWFSENAPDPSGGAQNYGGIKFFAGAPECSEFLNGKFMDADFDGDVSDSQRGGYACDGCEVNVNWNDWRPSRIQINDFDHNVFLGEPWYITLYGTGGGNYEIKDTANNVKGTCRFPASRRSLSCDTAFGPYDGLEALNCAAPDINV